MITAGNNSAQRGLGARGIRQSQVGILHRYYQDTASQYGLIYTRRRG